MQKISAIIAAAALACTLTVPVLAQTQTGTPPLQPPNTAPASASFPA